MYRINDSCREYANGNITYKPSKAEREMVRMDPRAGLEVLVESLFWLDTYTVGEEFCLSNWDTGCWLYNCHSDLVYVLSLTKLEECFETGKTLRLHARKIDDDMREYIAEWEGEGA